MITLRIRGVRRLILSATDLAKPMNLNGCPPANETPTFPAVRKSWRDFDPLWLHSMDEVGHTHLTVVK